MATKKYIWRTAPIGAEGTACRYVDSETGSDIFGDGSRQNPYQSLGKAWRVSDSKPTNIICRGYFSEDMSDGISALTISGDFFGGAIWDGALIYYLSFCNHSKITATNMPIAGSSLEVGLGWTNVISGNTTYQGFLGSKVQCIKSYCNNGFIATDGSENLYIRMLSQINRKINFGSGRQNSTATKNTYYYCPIEFRKLSSFSTGSTTVRLSLFGNFDMYVIEAACFLDCLFLSDCKFYYNDEELIITGTTSEERYNSLIAEMDRLNIPASQRTTFKDCVFSTQTSEDVFNDIDHDDFTLKLDSDAVKADGTYYGALPPALNIPIKSESSQTPGTFDERSADGLINVVDDAIVLDENSTATSGEILSKIIEIDPTKIQINSIFSEFAAKFNGYSSYLSKRDLIGQAYYAEEILPIGRYVVKSDIIYNDINLFYNDILVITSENTSFTSLFADAKVVELLDGNIENVIYVRCRAAAYATVTPEDDLQRGATYLNTGNENITYRGRTIVPKESFIAVNDTDKFTATIGYEIGVIFDDTRVPAAEWVSAQMFGEYFVWKEGGVIKLDSSGNPISSGNELSFQTSANGGFSNLLRKMPANQIYTQFGIFIKKYDDNTN